MSSIGNLKSTEFMLEAIRLADENIQAQGGPFGAVIVKEGKVIARGVNRVTATNDPTAHAEVQAIREACRVLGDFKLEGCELYSSCEPCPMCLSAIYWARIEKVFFAGTREDAAQAGFDDDFLYQELQKSIETRRLPMQQMARNEAQWVFRHWIENEQKIKY